MSENNVIQAFEQECQAQISAQGQDEKLKGLARDFFNESATHKYSYHFSWMGRPIIQLPQDMMAMQEIIWQVKPDLIIECGIAHGGSIIYYASLLELQGHGEVLGIDLDIRPHNREAIEQHPMSKRIRMIEGSSIDPAIAELVRAAAAGKKVILVLTPTTPTSMCSKSCACMRLWCRWIAIAWSWTRLSRTCRQTSSRIVPGAGRQPEDRSVGLSGGEP